jgi:hypothetical protein
MTEDVSESAGQAAPAEVAPSSPSTDVAPETTGNTLTENVSSWKDNLPDDLKDHKSLSKFKEPEDVLKSYIHLEKEYGSKHNAINIPGEGSSDEEWNGFYDKFRPENAEGYNLEGLSDQEKEVFSKAFYDNGLSQKQVDNVLKTYQDNVGVQQREAFLQEGLDKIMSDAFGDDEKSLQNVKNHLNDTLSESDKDLIHAMPNEFVGLIFRLVKSNLDSFGAKEGGSLNNDSSSMALTGDQLDNRRKSLRSKIAELSKKPHQASEKSELIAELSKTYGGK